jgi:hypothetical protein
MNVKVSKIFNRYDQGGIIKDGGRVEDYKCIENGLICSKWESCALCINICDVTVFIVGTADQKS